MDQSAGDGWSAVLQPLTSVWCGCYVDHSGCSSFSPGSSRETLGRKASLSLALKNLRRQAGFRFGFGTVWWRPRLQLSGVTLWSAPGQPLSPTWSSQEGLFRMKTLKGWEGLMCWDMNIFRAGPNANGQNKKIQLRSNGSKLLRRAVHTVVVTGELAGQAVHKSRWWLYFSLWVLPLYWSEKLVMEISSPSVGHWTQGHTHAQLEFYHWMPRARGSFTSQKGGVIPWYVGTVFFFSGIKPFF